jgi:hypothetical protein
MTLMGGGGSIGGGGQRFTLHGRSSRVVSQLPTAWRVRCCVPPPQDTLHSVHAVHGVVTHGHACVLQGCVWVPVGQGVPLPVGWDWMTMLRVETPAPHVSEQSLQGPHVHTHGVGHASVLQGCVWYRLGEFGSGQAAPPLEAVVTTERVRYCVPPLQFAEQGLQGDHVELRTQSCTHGAELHV